MNHLVSTQSHPFYKQLFDLNKAIDDKGKIFLVRKANEVDNYISYDDKASSYFSDLYSLYRSLTCDGSLPIGDKLEYFLPEEYEGTCFIGRYLRGTYSQLVYLSFVMSTTIDPKEYVHCFNNYGYTSVSNLFDPNDDGIYARTRNIVSNVSDFDMQKHLDFLQNLDSPTV
jgi:hypothetical protein